MFGKFWPFNNQPKEESWQPGKMLKARPYQIEAVIGEGGFGITYRARHLDLNHQVVLKTPNAKLRSDPAYPRYEERFIKEGQMLAKLSRQAHPSIVRVSDLFPEDDIPCLVMDFVPGDSLFNLVRGRGPLPETLAVGYIRQIAEALVVTHDMGIVHRDAHPLNIMANQNRAVLIDFGIAGDIVPMVSDTRNAFFPAFAPFEQIVRGSGLPTVDVYTLGASLYYAVTGQLPTPALERKDNQALIPPKQHNPQISDKLQAAIIQAMALEAANRPQTMRDFLALLQPGANQQPVSPPPVATASASKPVPTQTQKITPATQKATLLDLRGYFILPEMKAQGMVRRLGRGKIREVIALNQELTIVIARGGATLFNLRTGEALWEIDCPAWGGAVTADGRLLALYRDHDIYLWDLTTGQFLRLLQGHTDYVYSVSFSPDGQTLASGSGDETVRLWDVATGGQLRLLQGHTNGVRSVSFSPDGKTLAYGSDDKTVRLWDVATGREVRQLTGHADYVWSVSFSPDGKILASGSDDKTVRLWDVATGQLRQLTGHTDYVYSVSFSPDGKYLASGSEDKTVRLWDVATGQELRQFQRHTGLVWSVSFSPDGKTLASGSWDDTMRLWDVATGRELRQFTGHTNYLFSVSFSPDGKTLASAGSYDKTVRLWDVATGRELRQLTGYTSSVRSLSFSRDGKTLASGSSDKTVRLWDVATGRELRQLQGHKDWVRSVSFSSDGKTLASGSDDKTVRLWDVATGRELRQLTGHASYVDSVSFSPDGKTLASGSDDKTVRLWDVATGRELRQLQGHTSDVISVSFSPDGQTLASSGSDDKTVRLWDVAMGRELRQLTGYTSIMNSVSFSPDGLLASGGWDGVVRLWRL